MIERAETTKAVKCIALTYVCDNCGKREVVATMDENTSPDRRNQLERNPPMPDGAWGVVSVAFVRVFDAQTPIAHFCPKCVDGWSIGRDLVAVGFQKLVSGEKSYRIVGSEE